MTQGRAWKTRGLASLSALCLLLLLLHEARGDSSRRCTTAWMTPLARCIRNTGALHRPWSLAVFHRDQTSCHYLSVRQQPCLPSLSSLRSSSSDTLPHQATPLSQVMRVRGKVDAGYRRGGKKLGFPTANLPSSLFQNALEDVSTGVYFGWAVVEDEKDDSLRTVVHKAAVNVGYSPTFEGQENTEKIIEAHLIENYELADFYNQTMRLVLVGSLRPELKFESFPALVEAITNDVQNAEAALDEEMYSFFRNDGFLVTTKAGGTPWVGTSGGDEVASWEFQDMGEARYAITSIE